MTNASTPRGFEPLRAEPNGFRVHLLNRSDTVSMHGGGGWQSYRRLMLSLPEGLSLVGRHMWGAFGASAVEDWCLKHGLPPVSYSKPTASTSTLSPAFYHQNHTDRGSPTYHTNASVKLQGDEALPKTFGKLLCQRKT